ncbi:uncharacterized protein LACBIDRAFT_308344 [Laccaria bicolor S238N-H82]|uniref:Predicted protein n=1 Tax=Laccaria bicolor (strain S238N-H82 / ATCC MYA-4686) TaxID=486041 RepID=B0DS48_LACBS|nr:uncharacterized protein LACBIDRAFT_308344 [Laccaria bicolor S238N-H82]EDR02636.1 predicted protein [Laccaria bicolor S238N-H82]|eukprot:XP_001886680.1 predicted protein [Laccaria bicolor S238N-H82]
MPMTKKTPNCGSILRAVKGLSTCSYTSEAFSELQGKVQDAIDRLNLEDWVTELDGQDLLPVRDVASKRRGDKRMKEENFMEGHMMVHEIRI